MRKRTIVIIISLISAFILMSGGYGSWQKPLIITGKIKVIELPPPPIIEVVQINTDILDLNQPVTVGPEVPNIPEEIVGIVPNEQNGVGTDSSSESKTEEIEPASIDQDTKINEESSDSIVNQDQEQDVSEAAKGENTDEVSIPKAEPVQTSEVRSIDTKLEVVE